MHVQYLVGLDVANQIQPLELTMPSLPGTNLDRPFLA